MVKKRIVMSSLSCLSLVFLCFGDIVKSNVGGRQIVSEEDVASGPSASDYIQEGLVCLYDGIENQGFGNHIEGIGLPWVDCISGIQIAQNYQVRVGLYKDGVGCPLGNGPVIPLPPEVPTMTEWTVEYCADMAVGVGTSPSFLRGNKSVRTNYPVMQWYVPSVSAMILAGGYGYGLYIQNSENRTMYSFFRMSLTSHIAGLALLGDETISKRNGLAPWGQFETDSLYMVDYTKDEGYIMRIKCIRIYNRPLTDVEIEHNYKIDCERFVQ